MIANLSRSPVTSKNSLAFILQREIGDSLDTLCRGRLYSTAAVVQLIDSVAKCAHATEPSTISTNVEPWCQIWFLNLLRVFQPSEKSAQQWLPVLALLGHLDWSNDAFLKDPLVCNTNPLRLFLNVVIPTFSDGLTWSHAMTLALTKWCIFMKPVPVLEPEVWYAATLESRQMFIELAVAKICEEVATLPFPYVEIIASILCSVGTVLLPTGNEAIQEPELFLTFFNIILQQPCLLQVQKEKILELERYLVTAQSTVALHSLISSVLNQLEAAHADEYLPPFVRKLINVTMDLLWSSYCDHFSNRVLLSNAHRLPRVELCRLVWGQALERLRGSSPPNPISLLTLCRSLFTPKEQVVWTRAWIVGLVAMMSRLCRKHIQINAELITSPRYLHDGLGGFPISFLSDLLPLITTCQLGLRLRLHDGHEPDSYIHRQLVYLLSVCRVWFSPLTEQLSASDFALAGKVLNIPRESQSENELSSVTCGSLTAFVSLISSCLSELVSNLSWDDFFDICTSVDALFPSVSGDFRSLTLIAIRASFGGRLQATHPMQWPVQSLEASSCSTANTPWLYEHLIPPSMGGVATIDSLRLLCEVFVPSGMLRRCLPRSELLAHVNSIVSIDFIADAETLARLLELIASLCSVKFIGAAYSIPLAPLILDDIIRNALVEVDAAVSLPSSHPEFVRATVAAIKILQVFVLLRQPWQTSGTFLDPAMASRGIALLSLRLRQPKPRLSRDQWDALLCMAASWVTQAVPRPFCASLFTTHVFQLVAAIGALFVNSICSSTTVNSALLTSATTSQLIFDEEWDASLLDLPEDYDCEDDGSVPESDISVFDDTFDVSIEEAVFESANLSLRRLAPPALVQKDWDQFFSGNLYGCLLPLALEACLPTKGADVEKDTHNHISALCAATATCTTDRFLGCLQQQPEIIANFLIERMEIKTPHYSPPKVQGILSANFHLAPHIRDSLDLCLRLLTDSPFQSGQLLGHILLTRLVCSWSLSPVRRMSDMVIPHLPSSWVYVLTVQLPDNFESKLRDPELAIAQWGRGTASLIIKNEVDHKLILAYLLAWDAIVSLLSSASQQSRAGLQSALLSEAWRPQLYRLLLLLGLFFPAPSGDLLGLPSELEPDDRLLLSTFATRRISNLEICVRNQPASGGRRNLPGNPLTSMESIDSPWCDAFAEPDRLVRLPGYRSPDAVSHFALRLFRRLLAESPALMRCLQSAMLRGDSFGVDADFSPTPRQTRQLAGHVDRLVRRYFSATLIADEVRLVERRAARFKEKLGTASYTDDDLPDAGSVDIKGRPLSREVVTVYHFSADQSLKMFIKLPENFPLAPVTVEIGQDIRVPTQNWRSCIVHLSLFINNQNGSILDGIGLWLRNLKKKSGGVEECAICYSVIHDRNFSFPRMQCRVCKKRFHNDCMYRFFQTSRNPTCPLCRSLFFASN